MRRRHTRSAAAITAIAAGGFAVYTLQPSDKPVATLAARSPAVQYRTQVIRRTVHVVRHEHAAHGPNPRGAVATGGRGRHGAGGSAPRTGASGHHSAAGSSGSAGSSGAVATRASGGSGGGGSVASGSGSSGSSAPVSTRTSASHSSGSSSASHTLERIERSGDDAHQRFSLVRLKRWQLQRLEQRAGHDPHQQWWR